MVIRNHMHELLHLILSDPILKESSTKAAAFFKTNEDPELRPCALF